MMPQPISHEHKHRIRQVLRDRCAAVPAYPSQHLPDSCAASVREHAPGNAGQQFVPYKREAELVSRGEVHVVVEPQAGEEVGERGVSAEDDA